MNLSENLDSFKTLAELQDGLRELSRLKAKQQAQAVQQAAAEAQQAQQAQAQAQRDQLLRDLAQAEARWLEAVAQYEAGIDAIREATRTMGDISNWQGKHARELVAAGVGGKFAISPKIQPVALHRGLWR